ncbi:MAG: GH36-type glycosyl hydrolase domain-containing protein [Roseburia inulinivorans]
MSSAGMKTRFIRGFTEAGETIGKRTDNEANMWLNPQSWSVISGLATEEQTEKAMENVYEKLNTSLVRSLWIRHIIKKHLREHDLQCRNKGKCRYSEQPGCKSLAQDSRQVTDDKIDLFLVEADYALKYVDTDYTMARTQISESQNEDLQDQYQYTKDVVNRFERCIKRCFHGRDARSVLFYNREARKRSIRLR